MAKRLAYTNPNLASSLSKRCAGCGDNAGVAYHTRTGLYICPACDPVRTARELREK